MPTKVCIVGCGNWGSAIARIVGSTAQKHDDLAKEVSMWVFEEMVDGKKLSEIINTTHENVKYLPKIKLPENVVAVPDLLKAVSDADVLVFVVPHQFIDKICADIKGKLKPGTIGVTLIKGIAVKPDGQMELISEILARELNIEVAVLMGANLANGIANEEFSEATIGVKNKEQAALLKKIFQVDYFRIKTVTDTATVELCGALKNIVACGAGFSDGLHYGDNTKAAVIRLGLMEMTVFVETFYPGSSVGTFFESCGIADLITTCYGGRNRRCAEAFVKTGKTLEELEKEMLNGQRLQGPHTAELVYKMLQNQNLLDRFPLFVAVHRICIGELKPKEMITCLANHPEHI